MTLRSKLLFSYAATVAVTFLIGSASIWAILRWRDAASDLTAIYAQEIRAERMRAELFLQISHSLQFLNGDTLSEAHFWTAGREVREHIDTLLELAGPIEERDHIVGLEETHSELVWIMEGFFERGRGVGDRLNRPEAHARLDEISTEVTDDVVVLSQYYRDLRIARIAAAEKVGALAGAVIVTAALAAVVALGVVLALMRRWLERPMAELSRATAEISSGNFHAHVSLSQKDEWGRLAEDINNLARSLTELRARLQDQERLAALGEVAAYAAHNIRNPLAGVRAAAQVARQGLAPDDGETADSLDEMIQSIDRLDIWVKRMLGFAKPLNYQPALIDINDTLRDALALSGRSHQEKQVAVQTAFGEGLPLTLADPVLLEQAFSAALNNAFEAVPVGGCVRVETELKQTLESENGRTSKRDGAYSVIVRICDNGSGVSPELQGKLFRLFASGKSGGAGLGLAQAKRIFDTHGGSIKIDNEPGAGCTVEAAIPVRKCEHQATSAGHDNQDA
ncbi:MAG: ATP-binding protein [Candidatus Zixiibacteriota bacterium]